MRAAIFHSNYPGTDLASVSARFVLDNVARDKLADALILLPTHRAAIAMREAFRDIAGGQTLLLPRMVSLADVGGELLNLLGHEALSVLQSIPAPMNPSQRLYLLAAQVMKFEQGREGDPRVEHAMRLAQYLAELQDRASRQGIALTHDKLRELFPRDAATHWQQAFDFLNIVGATWPAIEAAHEQTTQAAHEVALLNALRVSWENDPPSYPVFAVGSTASQPATRELLSAIARMEHGTVILPGLDPRMHEAAWESVHPGHPYFYLKQLLDTNEVRLAEVVALGDKLEHCSIWLEALCRVEAMGEWRTKKIEAKRFDHLRIVACQHAEEEARVITLLMREGLEAKNKRIALITPDEALMARVAVQLKQYGLTANRVAQGTLTDTESGGLLVALMEAIDAPDSTRALIQLLRHPLMQLGNADEWPGWLDLFEKSARGISKHQVGQLPAVAAVLRDSASYKALQKLVRDIADLSRARLIASHWVERLESTAAVIAPQAGQGAEKVGDALEAVTGADLLGKLDRQGFGGLLAQALEASWRGPQFSAHPQLIMLTPVEARLQHFDRVILGNMTERLWPGIYGQSPWLNLVQQHELGLPGPEEHATLIAHDILMHGSAGEVFLTYPSREGGSPAPRSRYIERLLALIEAQGISPEKIFAPHYRAVAAQRYEATFAPEKEPRPKTPLRPERLRATLLDSAVADPFTIYAEAILGLRPLKDLDAEPEPRDFGSIAHKALQKLCAYWTEQGAAPDAVTLQSMVDEALRDFENRPAVSIFWSRRLMQALQFVNDKEAERRGTVQSEHPLEQKVATKHGNITLQGRIDRLEQSGEGAVVVDYKTGKPPTAGEIARGEALQLLAYAMLLAEQGQPVAGLEYWGLPVGKRGGVTQATAWTPELAAEITEKLHALLEQIMDPSTEFLARPVAGNERFDNDYDGISRYDEWAG